MKNPVLFLMFMPIAFLGACSSFPFNSPENSSWPANLREKLKGTVAIRSVSVEKPGDWNSLEKEVNDLLPLLFYEESYLLLSPGLGADYSADVKLREREYQDGWRVTRSLSAEVRIWAGEGTDCGLLPLSAGRSLVQGERSFASSRTLSDLLRRAVKGAIGGLSAAGLPVSKVQELE